MIEGELIEPTRLYDDSGSEGFVEVLHDGGDRQVARSRQSLDIELHADDRRCLQ